MASQSTEASDLLGIEEDTGFVSYHSRSISMVPKLPEKR